MTDKSKILDIPALLKLSSHNLNEYYNVVNNIIQKHIPIDMRHAYEYRLNMTMKNNTLILSFLKDLQRVLAEQKEDIKEKVKENIKEAFNEAINELESTVKKLHDFEDECNYCIVTHYIFTPDMPAADSELEEEVMDIAMDEWMQFRESENMSYEDEEKRENEKFRLKILQELEPAVSHAKEIGKSLNDYTIKEMMNDYIHLIKSMETLQSISKGYIDKKYREKISKIMADKLKQWESSRLVPLVYFTHMMGIPVSIRDVFEKNHSAIKRAFESLIKEHFSSPAEYKKFSDKRLWIKVSKFGNPAEAQTKVIDLFDDAEVEGEYVTIPLHDYSVKDIINQIATHDIIVEEFFVE
ncbi:MAG: hypothetical protein QXM92_04025 [Candidatus Anstonellales archaeon]